LHPRIVAQIAAAALALPPACATAENLNENGRWRWCTVRRALFNL
jgi:hypothetical protein